MSPEDLFQDVIDQDSAVAQLRKSSQNPVHAYLFVGPKGSCKWDAAKAFAAMIMNHTNPCLLYTSPSPRDGLLSRMPSSA